MESSISRRTLLNYIGIAILLAGVTAGEFIYWRSLHGAAAGDDSLVLLADSKVYDRTMEVNVGKFGLMFDQLTRAAGRLREPIPLAITSITASVLAAGVCFIAAARMQKK